MEQLTDVFGTRRLHVRRSCPAPCRSGGVKPSPGCGSSWLGKCQPVHQVCLPWSVVTVTQCPGTVPPWPHRPARRDHLPSRLRGQGIPQGRVKLRGAVPMPGWVSRFSLGGGQWWFMGKEKLAAGPDVPAFPLFLQPPERCSLFSFPDGQEESDGGNCHCLITVQGPLYDGRHGREQGSAALAGRGQPGLPFAPGSRGRLWAGHSQPFPLGCSVYKAPQCYLKNSQDQEVMVCVFTSVILAFFPLLFGEASELVERAMDGQRGGMEQSHPAKV